MRATIRLAALAAALLLCGGCFHWTAPVKPPMGILYTHYCAPLSVNSTNFVAGGPEGKSYTMAVRDPYLTGQGVSWAESAIQEAARQGGLKKVHYADYELLEILSFYCRFTVKVYGE
jgi:hypothetical protein